MDILLERCKEYEKQCDQSSFGFEIYCPPFRKLLEAEVKFYINDLLLEHHDQIIARNQIYERKYLDFYSKSYHNTELDVLHIHFLQLPYRIRDYILLGSRNTSLGIFSTLLEFNIQYQDFTKNPEDFLIVAKKYKQPALFEKIIVDIPYILKTNAKNRNTFFISVEPKTKEIIKNKIIKNNLLLFEKIFIKKFDKIICKDVLGEIKSFVGTY